MLPNSYTGRHQGPQCSTVWGSDLSHLPRHNWTARLHGLVPAGGGGPSRLHRSSRVRGRSKLIRSGWPWAYPENGCLVGHTPSTGRAPMSARSGAFSAKRTALQCASACTQERAPPSPSALAFRGCPRNLRYGALLPGEQMSTHQALGASAASPALSSTEVPRRGMESTPRHERASWGSSATAARRSPLAHPSTSIRQGQDGRLWPSGCGRRRSLPSGRDRPSSR